MSHKATVSMRINDKNTLVKALDLMGLTYKIAKTNNGLKSKSRWGVKADVDILLDKDSKGNDISCVGFKKNSDGSYEAVGDFYDLSSARTKDNESISESNFKRAVSKRYQYQKAIDELQAHGYTLVDEVTDFNVEQPEFTLQKMF